MTIVVGGKTVEEWNRRSFLFHALYWFIGVVVVGLINFAAPHPFWMIAQLICWGGVAVSLFRAWRATSAAPNEDHP